MTGKPDRTAFFECVLSIATPTGQSLTYQARCHGRITTAPIGVNGFGYDPVFYFPPLQKTFAQMKRAEKSRNWLRMHMPGEEKSSGKERDDD